MKARFAALALVLLSMFGFAAVQLPFPNLAASRLSGRLSLSV